MRPNPKERDERVQSSGIEVVALGNHPVHRDGLLQSCGQMQRIKRSMDGGHTCALSSPHPRLTWGDPFFSDPPLKGPFHGGVSPPPMHGMQNFKMETSRTHI
ncbi:hypothetical protein AVEN_225156-1 [Araneus ventricosus]|uniref:Uncharacterized protein n=1 Tax=Araneus ventricosus TaxID=182803 RepID=A0A4Y2FQ63_ARAVE|nr:hypothetical protein AVEN_225156-1 [Araneus ventricosus]